MAIDYNRLRKIEQDIASERSGSLEPTRPQAVTINAPQVSNPSESRASRLSQMLAEPEQAPEVNTVGLEARRRLNSLVASRSLEAKGVPQGNIVQRMIQKRVEKNFERGQDLVETAQGIGSSVAERAKKLKSEFVDASKGKKIELSAFGAVPTAVIGSVGDVIGETVIGAGKLLLPQDVENAIKGKTQELGQYVMETELAQNIATKWNELPQETKETLIQAGTVGETLLDLVGVGVGGKLAKEGLEVGIDATKAGVKATEGAINKGVDVFKTIKLPKFIGNKNMAEELTFIEKAVSMDQATKTRLMGKTELGDEFRKVVEDSAKSDLNDVPMEYLSKKYQKDVLDNFKAKEKELGRQIAEDKRLNFEVDQTEIDVIEDSVVKYLDDNNIELKDGKFKQKTGQPLIDQAELKNVKSVLDRIKRLRQNPKSKDLLQFRNAITDDISKFKSSTGVSTSALDDLNIKVRGVIRDINRNRLGAEKAKTIENFSLLKQINDPKIKSYSSDDVRKFAEIIKNDNIEFPLARIISDRSRLPKTVLDDIGQATGIDLLEYTLDNATMMKIMTDLYGTDRMKSLFKQGIGDAVSGSALSLYSGGTAIIAPVLKWITNKIADPAKAVEKIINTPTGKDFTRNLELFKTQKIDLKEFRKSLDPFIKKLENAQDIRTNKSKQEMLSKLEELKKEATEQSTRQKTGGLPATKETPELETLDTGQQQGVTPELAGQVDSLPDIIPEKTPKAISTKATQSGEIGNMNLIEEAKKYKSVEEFVNKLAEDLYILNKEAKKYTSTYTPTKEKYEIKNNLIKNLAEDTGEWHAFSGGGVGKLYRFGNETFHDLRSLADYHMATNKELKDIIASVSRKTGINKENIFYDDPIEFERTNNKKVFREKKEYYPSLGISAKKYDIEGEEKMMSDIVEGLPQYIEDLGLKQVTPPTKNEKGVYSKELEDRLKYVSENIKTKAQLTDIWNKANKK